MKHLVHEKVHEKSDRQAVMVEDKRILVCTEVEQDILVARWLSKKRACMSLRLGKVVAPPIVGFRTEGFQTP